MSLIQEVVINSDKILPRKTASASAKNTTVKVCQRNRSDVARTSKDSEELTNYRG